MVASESNSINLGKMEGGLLREQVNKSSSISTITKIKSSIKN